MTLVVACVGVAAEGLMETAEVRRLAYPSNSVEASSTLSHHAAAERLGLLPRLTAVRESRSRLLETGTHCTGMPPDATMGGGYAITVQSGGNQLSTVN